MANIIGIRFKKAGKIYFFDPAGNQVNAGEHVIVETAMGMEYGEVVIANRQLPQEKIVAPLKKIIRIATRQDAKQNEENKKQEKEAFKICEKKIKEHNLPMKLMDVEFKFDKSKILFFFTAEGRIDFRDLVKDLAAVYKTRIELRQIGVRDEVKRLGGNGVCGRELCCCSFLGNFETMCCLQYEQNVYEEKLKRLPKIGAIVKTEDGQGEVCGLETLKEIVKVKFKDGDENFFKKYNAKDIKIIKNIEKEQEGISKEDMEELKKMEELDKTKKTKKILKIDNSKRKLLQIINKGGEK